MRYLSVCSGIEAASAAWEPLGWHPVGFAEVDPFCSALLAQRFPNVTNYGDLNGHDTWEIEPFDILIGGTPCQSFSLAGKRAGLNDPRGNLAMVFLAIARKHRPRWIVWENVPGVLSSGGGRDFGAFLGTLGDLGYGWAYRVLDAQFFGVPQRRRRVFVVGCLGDRGSASEVLFEREGVRGDSAEGGQARQGASAVARAGAQKRGRGGLSHTLGRQCGHATEDGTGRGSPIVACADVAPTLLNPKGRGGSNRVPETCADSAHSLVSVQIAPESGQGWWTDEGVAGTVDRQMGMSGTGSLRAGLAAHTLTREHDASEDVTGRGTPLTATSQQVRRLTPCECERLQGFPDDWTAITYRGKAAADGPRYAAIGNSMAVPVIRWIGKRIEQADRIR